jgi:predicted heme/steroid binding protein/uncharacterized membrane protein
MAFQENKKMSSIKKVFIFWGFFFLSFFLLRMYPAWTTVEYTCQTEQSCSFCHENPDGGGTLTTEGEKFMDSDYSFEEGGVPFTWKRPLKLVSGFLHILFAIEWFGTIFYIHLFIKPASLTSGLPLKERILGWVCILVVGLTGIVLSVLRLGALSDLWTTTFGIVWLVKVALFLIMVAIAALATTRINRKMREAHAHKDSGVRPASGDKGGDLKTFVFEGTLYDVSGSKLWKDGIHMGRHHAGGDLTSAMTEAPHGVEVLERLPSLGPAGDTGKVSQTPAVRHFIFMAYFILFCMLGVIFCVAYWNWGPSLITPLTNP